MTHTIKITRSSAWQLLDKLKECLDLHLWLRGETDGVYEIEVYGSCPYCNGVGRLPDVEHPYDKEHPCDNCEGSGWV